MAKYIVTFCAMDGKTGSSPMWHSCLLLSVFNKTTGQYEVVETCGYYGLKTDSYPNPSCGRQIKMKIGLNLDSNNHGFLEPEKVRYLELGYGLWGAHFEVTQERFNILRNRIHLTYKNQETAIAEYVHEHNIQQEELKTFKHYSFEHRSHQIFEREKAKARQEGRASRLQEFELSLLPTAYDCKVKALELLEGILKPEQIKRLKGYHFAIPRSSGPMAPLLLYSEGPTRVHETKQQRIHYRDGCDPGVRVFWTIPPAKHIEAKSPQVTRLVKLYKFHYEEAEKIAGQLQQIERIIRDAEFEGRHQKAQAQLITLIQTYYKAFSVVDTEPEKTYPVSYLQRYLFGTPQNSHEQKLLHHINQAKGLLNNLYATLIHSQELRKLNDSGNIEAVVIFLKEDRQKAICKVMQRPFIKDQLLRAAL